MDRFLNTLKAHASALDRSAGQPRFALVTSVDPHRYAARVSLQPEGVITGWLPILSPWVGAGWGVACPPSPGDQVLVVAQEGDAQNGVIVGRSYSDQASCPGAPPGELWLVHASGSSIRLTADGAVHVIGDLHVQGSVIATRDVTDMHGALSMLRTHYDQHTHTDSRGGTTSTPSPQD